VTGIGDLSRYCARLAEIGVLLLPGSVYDEPGHVRIGFVRANMPDTLEILEATRAAVAARVAPIGYIAGESMRQATRRAEQHVTQLLARVRKSSRTGAARRMIAAEGGSDHATARSARPGVISGARAPLRRT